jgi:hypothetical protein
VTDRAYHPEKLGPGSAVNAHPALSSGPKEEPLTDQILPQPATVQPPHPDCPNCLALRGTSRLLAESALYLIDRNAALTIEMHDLRCRLEAGR